MSNPICSVCGLEPGTVGSKDPLCGTCHFIEGIANAGKVSKKCKNGYDAAAAAWKKMKAMAKRGPPEKTPDHWGVGYKPKCPKCDRISCDCVAVTPRW